MWHITDLSSLYDGQVIHSGVSSPHGSSQACIKKQAFFIIRKVQSYKYIIIFTNCVINLVYGQSNLAFLAFLPLEQTIFPQLKIWDKPHAHLDHKKDGNEDLCDIKFASI